MPSVGSGGITFTGITTPIACEMSSGYGTAPSAGTIRFREQSQAPRVGNLTLDCDGSFRHWRDCKLNAFQRLVDAANSGIVVAQVLDRRWRWQFGTISGRYNITNVAEENTASVQASGAGRFERDTEKSPRELATLLFKAMGEVGADVSAMPNDARPTMEWDVNSAADELAQLCELLACRVILGNDDKARVVRLGQGRTLQDSPFAFALGQALNTPDPPDIIKLVGAPIVYQTRLPLEAVGLDVDHNYKPIDDLSYTPPTKWEKETPESLGGVLDEEITDSNGSIVRPKQLAQNTVFRCYRVWNNQLEISKDFKGVLRRHIVAPEAVMAQTHLDEQGVQTPDRAFVAGVWCTPSKPNAKNSEDNQPVVFESRTNVGLTELLGFSWDADRLIVTFAEPVYRLKTGGGVEPAELSLYIAVQLRDPETRGLKRYEKTLRLANTGGSVTQTIVREDVVQRIVNKYDSRGAIESSDVFDESALDKRADYYLQSQRQLYLPATQLEVHYKGINNITPDGLVQQVVYSVDTSSGAETSASQGFEANRNIPSYEDWRQRQQRTATALARAKAAKGTK